MKSCGAMEAKSNGERKWVNDDDGGHEKMMIIIALFSC